MTDSPEGKSLRTLTGCVVQSLNKLNKALGKEASPKRDKDMLRLLKELEICNDDAMRQGLQLSPARIAQMKTGRSRSRSAPVNPSEPRVLSPFSQLMQHHANQFVDRRVPDAAAQGQAISYILKSFTPGLAIQKYNEQLEDSARSNRPWRVSWLTVKRDIARIQTHGVRPLDAAERNDARYSENLEFIADLRGSSGGDYH